MRPDRPSAEALLPVMLEQGNLKWREMKLTQWAKEHQMGRAGCPKRHLLAAVMRTPFGPWIVWRGKEGPGPGLIWRGPGLVGPDWQYGWTDELHDPAAVWVWCSSCKGEWFLDLSDTSAPTRHPRVR
jgi:hypothetical protein